MTSAIRSVGVIGAGRMGRPIIGHLARKGFQVAASDLDPGKREAVEQLGATWVDTSASLARRCEAILVCVGYDQELRALMSGPELLGQAARGMIVAVLSTVHPRTIEELAQAARASGVSLVDATVCRGGRAADEGTLLTFIGGDEAVVERLTPVLATYSTDIVRTGGVGSAQVAKTANNLVMWACLIADHEALALAARYGVDADALRVALIKSSADNYVLRNWGINTMAWAEDDMVIAEAMADDVGIRLPQATLNHELCRTLKPRRFRLDEYGT